MLGSIAALVLLATLGTGIEGSELLGKPAPAWDAAEWIQGQPLTLEGLRGRVVLVALVDGSRLPLLQRISSLFECLAFPVQPAGPGCRRFLPSQIAQTSDTPACRRPCGEVRVPVPGRD